MPNSAAADRILKNRSSDREDPLKGLRDSSFVLVSFQDSQADKLKRQAADILKAVSESNDLPRAWDKVLSRNPVPPPVLAEALFQLHREKKHEALIHGIESALRNDHGEAWMYDTLAAEMKIAGRPQAQINRVLLSRIDFTRTKEADLLYSAAMIARFGAHEQAMQLCREAIKRNPWQPVSWGLARRFAERTKSLDDQVWAATGTLKYVWDGTRETLHETVELELSKLLEAEQRAGRQENASKVREALSEARQRDLRISLIWTGDADLDLSVVSPSGKRCSYKTPLTSEGGMLIDQSDGGKTTARGGRHREEFVIVAAEPGRYLVKANYVLGRVITGHALLQVKRYENTAAEKTQSIRIAIGERNAEIPVQLDRGRVKVAN